MTNNIWIVCSIFVGLIIFMIMASTVYVILVSIVFGDFVPVCEITGWWECMR